MTDDERPGEAIEPGSEPGPDAASPPRATRSGHPQPAPEDSGDPDETVDKTDMSAVGDDGQVFGG